MSEIKIAGKMPERGQVYWAALDPTLGAEIQKTRPVIVVSANPLNRARRTVIIVPLSTSSPAIKNVNIELTGGSVARCDQVRSIDKQRLRNYMGAISNKDLSTLSHALVRVMDLDC